MDVPTDKNGGAFSYEGIAEEGDYWFQWETSSEEGENFALPIYFNYGKFTIEGPATVTVSLNKYKGYDFNNVIETLFTCEVTAKSDSIVPISSIYKDSMGNTQKITGSMDLYLQKGDKGSLQVNGTAAEGKSFVWETDSEASIDIDTEGRITAKEAGVTEVSVMTTDGEPMMTFQVYVLDLSVAFEGSSVGTIDIAENSILEISKAETGIFSLSGAENLPAGVQISWQTGGDDNRPILISSGKGELFVRDDGGTATAWVEIQNPNTLEASVPLYLFTITTTTVELEAVKVLADGANVEENGTVQVEGSDYKIIEVLGKYAGQEEYVPLSYQGYTLESDSEILSIDNRTSACGFLFSEPGSAKLTVNYEGGNFVFRAESSYVPVEKLELSLPETVELHTLVYGMGTGENYTGIPQTALTAACEIIPSNASFANHVVWSSDNDGVAEYMDTHSNGFVAHDAGTAAIAAKIDQGKYGDTISASQTVAFQYKYPVEELKTDTPEFTVEIGKKADLDIQFTPEQPSQGLILWEQSGSGEVEVQRGINGDYDSYSNLKYSVKGVKAGTVTLTGTPVSAAEGASPSITFTVVVTENGTEPPILPDTAEIVKGLKESAQKYYEENPITWAYGEEWNVIALNRAGLSMDETEKEIYLESVKAEVMNDKGSLTAEAKPTDLARVILALYSLGENPRDFAGTDLLQRLMQSDDLDQGSNESIWALIALDAVGESIPEGSAWTRDSLLAEILRYQCDDGSFGLSGSGKTGSVDMTAMALQALAGYQEKEEIKTATDRALDYLREQIYEGDYRSVESNAQVAVALLTLGMDPGDKANGFAEDDVTVFQAMAQYDADGCGFKHEKSDEKADKMATQQVLLSVAAWERYSAGTNSVYDMTDVAAPVEPEEPIGYVTLSVEKFTIGQGYLIEPELIPIYEEACTAAEIIAGQLEEYGLEYENTGSVEERFYLASIIDTEGSKTAYFPETTIKYAEENNIKLSDERKNDSLGQFDYSNGSGWMYTVNDDMTDKGMSQMLLKDGDVVRVRFTAVGYGQDLGNENRGYGSFMPVTNGDELTAMLAEINSADKKEELLSAPNVKAAYENAIQVISNLENDQSVIDAAADALEAALKNPDEADKMDYNGDGVVDTWDAVDLLKDINAGGTITTEKGDLNGDGIVDTWDAVDLLKLINETAA